MKFSSLFFALGMASAEHQFGPIDWDKHPYDEQEYFKDIPAYVDLVQETQNAHIAHAFI